MAKLFRGSKATRNPKRRKEGAVVNFGSHKAQTKVKPMHFAVKMYERKFGSRVSRLKSRLANNVCAIFFTD